MTAKIGIYFQDVFSAVVLVSLTKMQICEATQAIYFSVLKLQMRQ